MQVADVVSGQTDGLVSDQYVMLGWRFRDVKRLEADVVESELGATWRNYDKSSRDVLIMATTNDDGTNVGGDLIKPCR
jgi:hypothetical protein